MVNRGGAVSSSLKALRSSRLGETSLGECQLYSANVWVPDIAFVSVPQAVVHHMYAAIHGCEGLQARNRSFTVAASSGTAH